MRRTDRLARIVELNILLLPLSFACASLLVTLLVLGIHRLFGRNVSFIAILLALPLCMLAAHSVLLRAQLRRKRTTAWRAALPLAVLLGFSVPRAGAQLLPVPGQTPEPQGPLPLAVVEDVPLPGGASRFDSASFDPARHEMFVTNFGADEVLAFDTEKQRIVGRVPGIRHARGVLVVPELRRVFAGASGSNEVVAIDEDSLAVAWRAPGGATPDGLAYVPYAHRLFVADETGRSETVIDVRSQKRIATIDVGGEVGDAQYDPSSRHVFVNVQSRGELVEIDPEYDSVLSRYILPGGRGNHGLLIEPDAHLAFIPCERSDSVLVFDLRSPQVLDEHAVGHGPDGLAYDAGLKLLYVASEDGVVSVFRFANGKLTKTGDQDFGPTAHVVAVDPATHESFFPLITVEGNALMRVARPRLELSRSAHTG